MMNTQQQYPSSSPAVIQSNSKIQKLLDDNSHLISWIIHLQSKGKQTECLEPQRTLYRNLTYLTQFDPSAPYHSSNLPPSDVFLPKRQSMMDVSIHQHSHCDPIYPSQMTSSAIYSEQYTSRSTVSQQRSPYLQRTRHQQYPRYHQQQYQSSYPY